MLKAVQILETGVRICNELSTRGRTTISHCRELEGVLCHLFTTHVIKIRFDTLFVCVPTDCELGQEAGELGREWTEDVTFILFLNV